MTHKPDFDSDLAHKYFSADCFNRAWELIDKPDRTPEDNEQMIRLAHASVWHWTQRPDCTVKNLSVGFWQISRIYALLGEPENARKYAQLCLDNTPSDEVFCLGYAYEALARAESIAGNGGRAKEYLAEAWRKSEAIADVEEKQLLVNDLNALE